MVEIPSSLHSLFSTTVEEQGGTYIVEVPVDKINQEALTTGNTYQVVILRSSTSKSATPQQSQSTSSYQDAGKSLGPPVDEDEVRDVTIEAVGEQGDGIAKVGRGYVVIVPHGQPGDELTIEITQVQENVAFASILDEET